MTGKLSHLSAQQIEALIERYYANEKIENLIQEYNLKLRASDLVRNFPPEVLTTECIYCKTNIIRPRVSREHKIWKAASEYCPSCSHINNDFCSCKNCKKQEQLKQEIEEQRKQDSIDSWFNIKEDRKIDITDLSLIDRVYLGAILREGISEDFNYIRSFESFINPLAPTIEFRNEIIDRLVDIDAIAIHPNTSSKFIEIIDYEKGSYRYYPHKVNWALNVKNGPLTKVPLVESIMNPSELENDNYEEAFTLWKRLTLFESIEYFQHTTTNILGVDYSIGEKTKTILQELTNDYSVSQIYGILYKSTNDALRFQAEKGASSKHASNTIIGKAQSYGERAKINKWTLQKYGRIKDCPESALSKFFFERVIKIGYDGFNEVPSINRIMK